MWRSYGTGTGRATLARRWPGSARSRAARHRSTSTARHDREDRRGSRRLHPLQRRRARRRGGVRRATPSATASRKSTSPSRDTSTSAPAACASSTTKSCSAGDVSLAYVSRLMNRRYTDTPTFRKVLQSIWYQVNDGQEIYVDRRDPAGSHRQGRHRLGRRVRQAVQQAAVRLRPGAATAGSRGTASRGCLPAPANR